MSGGGIGAPLRTKEFSDDASAPSPVAMGPLVQPLHTTETTITKGRIDNMQNELQSLTTAWRSQTSQMAELGSNISEMVTMMQTMQSQMLKMNSEINEMSKTKAVEVHTLSGVYTLCFLVRGGALLPRP